MKRQVDVILLGLGGVGRTLARQIVETRQRLAQVSGLFLRVIGLLEIEAYLWDEAGLPDQTIRAAVEARSQGLGLDTLPGSRPLDNWTDQLAADQILVDLTASSGTGPTLQAALNAGSAVVLANKKPLAQAWSSSQSLFEYPFLRYEATVGAGLPVIKTLRDLVNTGDEIVHIEGCFSGTLGFLCSQFDRGKSYSAAVREAHAAGFTEPDPREDLSGRDVARKALILARTAGWPLEPTDLSVEALYPAGMADLSPAEFMDRLESLDDEYATRVAAAAEEGKVLRYVARVSSEGCQVGLQAVPKSSSLGALDGPANYVAFTTRRYSDTKLAISGPGAGLEVTAAGVLGDVMDVALSLSTC